MGFRYFLAALKMRCFCVSSPRFPTLPHPCCLRGYWPKVPHELITVNSLRVWLWRISAQSTKTQNCQIASFLHNLCKSFIDSILVETQKKGCKNTKLFRHFSLEPWCRELWLRVSNADLHQNIQKDESFCWIIFLWYCHIVNDLGKI